MGYERCLESDNEEISKQLISLINKETIKYLDQQRPSRMPTIFKGLGIHTDLKKYLLSFLLVPASRQEILSKHIIPLLKLELSVTRVTPISLDVEKQAKIFSLLKILNVRETLGDDLSEGALRHYVEKKDVFSGIEMKAGFPILSFLDVYLQIRNVFVTFPINEMGVCWHFYDMPKSFPHEMMMGFSDNFKSDVNPLIKTGSVLVIPAKNRSETFSRDMLKFSVRCLNNMFEFANDVFNFLDKDGSVNYMRQMQYGGTLHLLYADLIALNATALTHIQMNMALGALSKISNLCYSRPEEKFSDEDYRDFFFSDEMNIFLITSFTECRFITAEIRDFYKGIIQGCYDGLHAELSEIFQDDNKKKRIFLFRAFRNFYAHGTHLESADFGGIFGHSRGEIPSETTLFPFIILVGMSLHPERFFDFVEAEMPKYNPHKWEQILKKKRT